MRLTQNLFATLILCTFVCGSVMAQPPEREGRRRGPGARGAGGPGAGGPGGGGPGAFMKMIPVIAAIDANEDGTISSEEIANASAALKKLDKNGDGKLTADEIMPQRGGQFAGRRGPGAGAPEGQGRGPAGRGPGGAQGRGGEFFARMFEQRDSNKDGKLSGDEIPEQMAARLERIDTDGDKAISKAEIEKVMNRGGGRGRGGDQAGRPGGERPRRPQAEDDR